MSDHHPHHEHQADVKEIFRLCGANYTAQRKAIWEFFAGNTQGYAIREAAAVLKPSGIGIATVYRTIELFVKIGLLQCTQDSPGKIRYIAVCPGHSHTLICRGCRTVVEFDDCDLTLLERLLVAKTGFAIQGHHLEMYGFCPACQKSEPA